MLALVWSSSPLITNGCPKVSIRRRASARGSSALRTSVCRITNSSPPSRAIASVSRRQACRRSATALSRRSPQGRPKASLIPLKRSRSSSSTAATLSLRRARARAWSRYSRNSARFGRPVSASWPAWWRIRASARRSSVMSNDTVTTSATRPASSSSGDLVVSRTWSWREIGQVTSCSKLGRVSPVSNTLALSTSCRVACSSP